MKTAYDLALELVQASEQLSVLLDEKQYADNINQSNLLDHKIEIAEQQFLALKRRLESIILYNTRREI